MEQTFESAMERLEEITAELENTGVTLEQSMKLFEEGTQLISFCSEQLAHAEQKILQLTEAAQ